MKTEIETIPRLKDVESLAIPSWRIFLEFLTDPTGIGFTLANSAPLGGAEVHGHRGLTEGAAKQPSSGDGGRSRKQLFEVEPGGCHPLSAAGRDDADDKHTFGWTQRGRLMKVLRHARRGGLRYRLLAAILSIAVIEVLRHLSPFPEARIGGNSMVRTTWVRQAFTSHVRSGLEAPSRAPCRAGKDPFGEVPFGNKPQDTQELFKQMLGAQNARQILFGQLGQEGAGAPGTAGNVESGAPRFWACRIETYWRKNIGTK
eukprot:s172_g12.t3